MTSFDRVGISYKTAGSDYLLVTVVADGVLMQGPPRGKRTNWVGSIYDLEEALARLEDNAGPDAVWEALDVS